MADIAQTWTETARSPNCWDTDAPVFILGSDGQAHETRPTTSLAHDLAKQQPVKSSSPSSPSRRRRTEERPTAMTGASEVAPSRSRVSRVSVADRPLCGFGDATGSPKVRKSYGAPSSFEVPVAPATRRSSIASVKDRPEVKRPVRSSYDPIEKLLGMGMDKESARVALCAVGGDVEKAMRLVLEDSKAHVSRKACEWEFEGEKGWVPFDVESDRILQNANDRMLEACELRVNGYRYLIDFNSFTQLNLATQRTRRIRRRSVASSSAMAPVAHERGASTASAPAAATPAAAAAAAPVAPSGVPVHERARAKVPAATR